MLTHHVKHYLRFIDGGINTYCWMDGESSKVIKGRHAVHGKFSNVAKWEAELKNQGVELPTLHITLCETDLNGRQTNNIKAYRILCCDIDRPITEEEMLEIYYEYKVQMVVQSSPGKYHFYWRLERAGDLELWKRLQLGVASRLNGDLQLSLPTSMIRVPGFTRISKDGKQIMPSVLTFKDENKIEELSIKKIVKRWPWIWEEAEKGEKELSRQRKEAAKIARELMKARGTQYNDLKFASMTPDCGRNNTMYLSIYDIVYTHEEKLKFDEVMSYADELNESFKTPLGKLEVEKTVRSALSHGLRARKKKVREKRELVAALDTSKKETAKIDKKKQQLEVGRMVVDAILGDTIVPDSYLEISDILVDRIWLSLKDKKQAVSHNILAAAHKQKYYQRLTDYIVQYLKGCGAFKVNGYSVYLRGVNESGEVVRYRKSLDSDSLSSLLQHVLNRLYLYTVKVSLNGKGKSSGKVKGDSLLNHLEGDKN